MGRPFDDRLAHAQQKLILTRALAYKRYENRKVGWKMYIGGLGLVLLIVLLIILL